jgi:hypothetical protein
LSSCRLFPSFGCRARWFCRSVSIVHDLRGTERVRCRTFGTGCRKRASRRGKQGDVRGASERAAGASGGAARGDLSGEVAYRSLAGGSIGTSGGSGSTARGSGRTARGSGGRDLYSGFTAGGFFGAARASVVSIGSSDGATCGRGGRPTATGGPAKAPRKNARWFPIQMAFSKPGTFT